MYNFLVVLFKDKKKKKIINNFITKEKAEKFFNKKVEESQQVIYDVCIESGKRCVYELGLVHIGTNQDSPRYKTDNLGRNIKVKLDTDDMSLIKILPYRKEEKIYDLQKKRKISVKEFISRYLKGSNVKVVSIVNNKIIVQDEESVFLFTVKTELESIRFIECLSNNFHKIKRTDCIFVQDCSVPQKKYLLNLLESKGVDKKILYRKFTSLPQGE